MKKIFHVFKFIFVFTFVLVWIFSGWLQISRYPKFPPKIQEARAAT
mgnify:CR=1 FL=1